jgi:site-specific DNA-methyltransferase (adenine-specific)
MVLGTGRIFYFMLVNVGYPPNAYLRFFQKRRRGGFWLVKKYNVIYADPPWKYKQREVGRGNLSGANQNYEVMEIDGIKTLKVRELADDNAILFLWATVPLLPSAFDVIQAWGFKYKTLIVWEKTGILGMGNWVRVQEELLLIGVRGKVKPFSHQEKNIYKHPICDHSAKPHFFRELVMRLADKSLDKCNRLELFARSRKGFFPDYEYEGWDVFGNEVNNSIEIK